MAAFALLQPRSVEEALAELGRGAAGETVILAGGTDLLIDLEEGRANPTRIVSLRHLPWKDLSWAGGGLSIGSTLPLAALDGDGRLRRELPGLWRSVHAVGGVALRHRATLGGNLARASPASDLIPILLALEASVEVLGPTGPRTIAIDRFLRASRSTALGPGELIRSVLLPEVRPCEYLWQRVRPANDISQVGIAAAYSPSQRRWRLALGGVTPCPVRIVAAEAALSEDPTLLEIERAAEQAAARAPFVSDKRASEAYRRVLVRTLVLRAIGSVQQQRKGASPPVGST